MANFLTGLAQGAHQGLAHLASSRRAERMAKRENRRYENELLFRIGQAESAKADREKLFAYQMTRDKVRDQQWADEMGLRTDAANLNKDMFEETKRTNAAREEDVDLARQLQQNQFETARTDRIREHTDEMGFRRDEALRAEKRHTATMAWEKEKQIDANQQTSFANQLAARRVASQESYYNYLMNRDTNKPLTELERREIEADIELKKAQAERYRRMTDGSTPEAYNPTASETDAILEGIINNVGKDYVNLKAKGFWRSLNPWDDAPWDAPPNFQGRTIPQILRIQGANIFKTIQQEMPNEDWTDVTRSKFMLDRAFDKLLEADKTMLDEILDKTPGLTNIEKINKARREFVDEGIKLFSENQAADRRLRETPVGDMDIDIENVPRAVPDSRRTR